MVSCSITYYMKRIRVVGYVRVSTEQQADGGVSIEAQCSRLESYAKATDLVLVRIHQDAVSAKTLNRPGLRSALADLEAGHADGILVAKLDRLTRSVSDLSRLLTDYFSARFDLLSVADSIDTRSAAGRLVLNVLTSVGQWEREAIGERTREALQHLKSKGVRLGREPLGWQRVDATDKDGRKQVVRIDEELLAVDRIVELRKKRLSLRAICKVLEAEGHRTKRGGRWHSKVVRQIFLRNFPEKREG